MNASSLAQMAPSANDMAMNALIFGYAGHSLVTPHTAIKQLWWTDTRIEAKVTRKFVISKVRGVEREFLRHKLAFAGDLSDKTYLDCILDTTKRLFLIFAEIGCSDQIFGCIDDGWTDEDLPIALCDVPRLELSYKDDDALNQRFYKTQFMFLLRTMQPGVHVRYGPQEHIPIDMVNTLPPAVTLQAWGRVHLPGAPDDVFLRRSIVPPVGTVEAIFFDECLADVQEAQQLAHQHIARAWASYTSDGAYHILSDFVPEHTLRTFLEHRTPMQLMRLAPETRPVLLCEWMHCLADALSFLHHNDMVHGAVRPTNIVIDQDNHIAFADIGSLRTFQREKRLIKHEIRDYSGPELNITDTDKPLPQSPSSGKFSFRSLRKLSISSSSSNSSGGFDSAYASVASSRPSTSDSSYELAADIGSLSGFTTDHDSFAAFSLQQTAPAHRRLHSEPPSSDRRCMPRSSTSHSLPIGTRPKAIPEAGDIYSLGCIFLDIITFVLRGKLNDFIKFRSSKERSSDGKINMNTSFSAAPSKVEEWMDILEDESWQYGEAIYRGMPDLLRLVRRMLVQNPALRPTACHVRDRIGDILAITCGVEGLCCADRVWVPPSSDPATPDGEMHMAYPASGNLLQVRQSGMVPR